MDHPWGGDRRYSVFFPALRSDPVHCDRAALRTTSQALIDDLEAAPYSSSRSHGTVSYTHLGKTLLAFGMRYVVQLELILAPLFVVVALWPQQALTLFYGRSSVYVSQTLALRIGVIVFAITVPLTVFGAVLTGAGRTKGNLAMNSAGTLASLLSAPPLIFAGGVLGAMSAEIVTRGVRVLYAIRLLGPNFAANRAGEREAHDRVS